ncbi:hypothetical protein FisN_4Lu589 [Fistulifera solaris]|uniref:RING-type domain-containing protein n=1 Tax=Fistulifera solaris TaxID=1519565 RepID=A0A1Z5JYW9_FISSO|nr:hypothetical protein FisN_4Lu589 [Fistulifera solaris]|eukprot:GAX19197.1 hypothetical protein FisN_4Lu589 [Fistulifera solaris]
MNTETNSCPICWHDLSHTAVQGPCGHAFCRPCLERVLLATAIPTQGLCPMCRQSTSLFDLQQEEKPLYPYNPDLSEMTPLMGLTYLLQDVANLHNGTSVMHNRLPARILFDESGAVITYGSTTRQTVKFQWHNPSRTMRLEDENGAGPLTLTFACDWRTIHRASAADKSIVGCIYRASEEIAMLTIPRTPPTYLSNTLFGNTFCQAKIVGLASYHFVSKDECYISYEHTTTAIWGTTDFSWVYLLVGRFWNDLARDEAVGIRNAF